MVNRDPTSPVLRSCLFPDYIPGLSLVLMRTGSGSDQNKAVYHQMS